MPLVLKNRVRESTTTTGTGAVTLAGAAIGFDSFADIGNGNTTYYTIADNTAWEVGIGTYTASGTTLSRDTVLSNSLGTTALINFSAGTKDVFCTYPAEESVYGDGTTLVAPSGTILPVASGGTGVTTSTGTGSVVLSDSPTLTGTVLIGSPSGASTVTLGRSSGTSTVNVGTGSTSLIATRTVNIATNGSGTDIINIGRTTAVSGVTNINIGTQQRTSNATNININTGATGGNAYTTIGSNDGGSLTTIDGPFYVTGDSNYQILFGNTTSTGPITIGQSTDTQTTNIQAGATASSKTKTINIGTGGLAGSTTAITVGATTGTSVTANGTWTYSTPLAATNMVQATTSTSGYLSSTDWNTFNSKGSGSVTSVSGTGTVSGISLSGTVTSSGSLTLGGALDLSSPPTIGNTTPNTGAFTSVTTPSVTAPTTDLTLNAISTGVVNVNTLNGTGLRVTELSGGAVNTGLGIYSGTASQNTVYATPLGSGTNSNILLASKGSGNLILGTGSNNGSVANEQMRVSHTASAVNFVQVTGAATGVAESQGPLLSAQGSDGNINMRYLSKGAGSHYFSTNSTQIQFRIAHSAGAIANRLAVGGSNTGSAPSLASEGTDTNISMAFQPKGTGAIDLAAGSSGVNISNGGTVTAITRTFGGSGYTGLITATISAPTTAGGVQATVAIGTGAIGQAIVSGGTGYTAGNILNVVGGTIINSTLQQIRVDTVNGSGVILTVSVAGFGQYTTLPTNPVSVTGGSGSGATFNLSNFSFVGSSITNAGSGYIEQPTVTFSGGGGSGAAAYATVGSGTTLRSLGSTLSLNTTGGEQVRILDNGQSTVNYIQLFGASAGAGPQIQFTGSDASVVGVFNAKGPSGAYLFATNNTGQFRVQHTASAVNYVQVTGAATGVGVTLSSQGSDSAIPMIYSVKGFQNHIFQTNSGTNQFSISTTATAVNRLNVTGSTVGNAPVLSAMGNDTNIDLALTPKGTGGILGSINSGTFSITRDSTNNAIKFTATNAANLYLQSTGGGVILFNTADSLLTQVRIAHTASAVNYVQMTGAVTGSGALISAQGSDANIDLTLTTKGTGAVNLNTGGGTSFRASQAFLTGTAVNYIDASGRQTGLGPILSTNGSDANVRFNISSKGTEAVGLYTNLANQLQFNVTHTASSVNYVQVTGATTTNAPVISSQGSDTNLGMLYYSKGFGSHQFRGYNGSNIYGQFFANQVSPVNYIEFGASSSGNAVLVRTAGADTNIDLSLTSKGTGAIKFNTAGGLQAQINDATTAGPYTLLARGSSNTQKITAFGTANLALQSTGGGTISLRTGDETNTQLNIGHIASAVNRVDITGSTTGNAPVLSVSGSDTNIDIALTPKGTGNVRFGAYTGTILTPTGFIEIKDSGGTVRRLLVG
jgi:hypothetical protein